MISGSAQALYEPIRRVLASGNVPSSMLLAGGDNAARRVFAMRIAKFLLCSGGKKDGEACGVCPDCVKIGDGEQSGHPDLVIVDGSDKELSDGTEKKKAKQGAAQKKTPSINIRTVREDVMSAAWQMPHEASCRVFYVENAELLGSNGQNALLKLTEEAPDNVYFIFTTYDRSSLIDTILSRFTLFKTGDTGAPRLLGDEPAKSSACCARLCRAIAKGSEYELMLASAELTDLGRADAHDVLILLAQALTDALKQANGAPVSPYSGDMPVKELAKSCPERVLTAMTLFAADLGEKIASANMNVKLAQAMLSARFGKEMNKSLSSGR